MGSLKGNIQGLGKDIVAATLRAAGLQVIDAGVDVSLTEDYDGNTVPYNAVPDIGAYEKQRTRSKFFLIKM